MDERQFCEISLAAFYATALHHGTTGHNQLMLIDKMARESSDEEVKMAVRLGETAAAAYAMALLQIKNDLEK